MPTILHLTDIHFGWEGNYPSGLADRKVCLDGLLNQLRTVEPEWKPTIICLTGDIAWKGTSSDYAEAKKWLDELLSITGLTYNELVVCAGNHDVFREKAKKLPRPESTKDADEVLSPPIAQHFEGPFSDFIAFCKLVRIPNLKFGNVESQLVGTRQIDGVRLVVFNSAWFSKDNEDKGKLWLGQPHLKYMEGNSQLPVLGADDSAPITVALMHHPAEWLHTDEQHAAASRPNTMDFLAHRCHLLLTGHTHGEVRRADRIADGSLHFTGGSAYAGASHFNSFRLIRITANNVEDRSFEFDPRSTDNTWRPHPACARSLTAQRQIEQPPVQERVTPNHNDVRVALRSHALKQLDLKSRLLRPSGTLPAITKRPVSARVSIQHDQYDSDGRLVRAKNAEQTIPFYEAVRQSRRTLLFGDLGTGKSTLAAQLVVETVDRSSTSIAIFVPVKSLQISGQFTQRDLLNKIDEFIANEAWLKTPRFELNAALNQGIEVLIVLDGLDELERAVAARLLNRAATLVDNWPTIQVVSTARPIELLGVSYADWKNLHTVALDDTAKIEFLQHESMADGVSTDQAHEKATTLLHSLKEMTALDSIANSPLVLRLLYPRLSTIQPNTTITLGQLLYDLLIDRLGGWHKRDDKPLTYSLFEQAYSTAEQKAELLAILADRATKGQRTGYDEAKTLFQEKVATTSQANGHELAAEALSFYEWLGLITKTETVEFPLQPLAEACAAIGVLGCWLSKSDVELPDQTNWRVVSFVAAIARRRGQLERVRAQLTAYIDKLLRTPGLLPAACYVVAEAADPVLAAHTVQAMDNVGYRPLTWFYDERKISVQNVARTLVLAGDVGFDWFYKDYLDPRYPIPNAGCAVVREVFAEWAALVRKSLTTDQKARLSKLIVPYNATGEGHFYGVLTILSVLVPDSFSIEDRLWHQSHALDDRLFFAWVAEQFVLAKVDGDSARILNAVLLHRSNESIRAAHLWLDWNPNVELPYAIIQLAFRCASKSHPSADESQILSGCRQRLGEDQWFRFARWALANEGSPVAAGAAKVLFETGEQRLSVLGDVAMKAMHDGGYIAAAESILSALVQNGGEQGVRWLALQIAHSEEWSGAHSGWWRVLLAQIESVADGPSLLASCVRNLGQYTLPRYPEVREGFTRVLNGSKGKNFGDALRGQLLSLDPMARLGAASALVSSNPRGEGEPLFVAIRSRAKTHSFDWHEWESFCLTLDFGPSVLASLKSKLNQLEPHSRALALVILAKGGVQLEPAHRAELMTTLSDLGNWHLSREQAGQALLGAEPSFTLLLEQLERPKSESAQRAAERLLEYHKARLNPKDEAKCLAIRHATSSWTWELAAMMLRVVCDSKFAQHLLQATSEILEKGGRAPLLGLIAQAVTNHDKWKDVVWTLLCDDTRIGGSMESEGGGMTLLEFGLLSKEHGKCIGRAAIELLNDPRVKQNRWHEAYHWVALLADEFVGLDAGTLQAVILHGKPIGYSVTTALIGRLGEVPEKFSCDRTGRHRPAVFNEYVPKQRDQSKVVQQLKEFGRDSDELHPSLVAILQECIFLPPLDEAILTSISQIGNPGILISTTLRFMYGMPPKMEETIPLLDRWFRISHDERNRAHWSQLTKVWKILRGAAFVNNPVATEVYLAALDKAILQGEVWKLAAAWDVLELKHSLTALQVPIVFAEFARHPTYMHEVLFAHFCVWLAGNLDQATKSAVVQSSENAIVVLNESAWTPKSGEHSNPWACVLFPVIVWGVGSKNTESSEAVFLRGVRAIFEEIPTSQQIPRANLVKLFSRLDPLLAKTSASTLRSVIQRGAGCMEPSVSTFCRLIEGLGKNI